MLVTVLPLPLPLSSLARQAHRVLPALLDLRVILVTLALRDFLAVRDRKVLPARAAHLVFAVLLASAVPTV